MEVITIESEAFKKILQQLEEIRARLEKKDRQSPFSDPWLDNNEASRLLKVSKRTLQAYRDEGTLSFSQVGSKIYYRASDIEKFLQQHHKSAFQTKG